MFFDGSPVGAVAVDVMSGLQRDDDRWNLLSTARIIRESSLVVIYLLLSTEWRGYISGCLKGEVTFLFSYCELWGLLCVFSLNSGCSLSC